MKFPRAAVLTGILAAGAGAAWWLDLDPTYLVPGDGGLEILREFLGAAVSPDLVAVGDGETPLLPKALRAALTTVYFAAAAMSLSLVIGLVLGFLASSAWWAGDPAGGNTATAWLRRTLAPAVYGGARVLIALMRSVHELLWAVLFLGAMGLTNTSAVVAIAIPYGGTLAKVFSEMIDEAPRASGLALRSAGATPAQVFVCGILPRALPDMGAYAFYRFECALRSSAILGFFGIETLGLYLKLSFENAYYGEVWTYLYVLVALVLVVEAWSGALRAKLVAA